MRVWVYTLLCLGLAATLPAQEPDAPLTKATVVPATPPEGSPSAGAAPGEGSPAEVRRESPGAPAMSIREEPVRAAIARGGEGEGGLSALPGTRILASEEGEARLLVEGAERVVRVGDVLGADLVKSVAPGRIVLLREGADSEGGDALVILTQDGEAEPRTRVIWSKDPTAVEPPEVR
jgi:hypothetical protein